MNKSQTKSPLNNTCKKKVKTNENTNLKMNLKWSLHLDLSKANVIPANGLKKAMEKPTLPPSIIYSCSLINDVLKMNL